MGFTAFRFRQIVRRPAFTRSTDAIVMPVQDICYHMSVLGPRMRLRRTGSIPEHARVRHFDELSEDTQNAVFEAAGRPYTVPRTADLDDGDIVKFTDYYQVRAR